MTDSTKFAIFMEHLKVILPKYAPDVTSKVFINSWFPPFERFSAPDFRAVFDYARDNLKEFPNSPAALMEIFNTVSEKRLREKPLAEIKALKAASREFSTEENQLYIQDLFKIIRQGKPMTVEEHEKNFGVEAFEGKFGRGSYYP
jgi:hypothetical protein